VIRSTRNRNPTTTIPSCSRGRRAGTGEQIDLRPGPPHFSDRERELLHHVVERGVVDVEQLGRALGTGDDTVRHVLEVLSRKLALLAVTDASD